MSEPVFINVDLTETERSEIILCLGVRQGCGIRDNYTRAEMKKLRRVRDSILRKLEVRMREAR